MEEDTVPDLGDAIAAHLQANGEIPDGGSAVEVEYALIAHIRVFHADGTTEPVYRHVVSSRVEPHAFEGLAARLLERARELSRRWG